MGHRYSTGEWRNPFFVNFSDENQGFQRGFDPNQQKPALAQKRQERLLVVATAIFPYLDHDSAELRLQTMPIAMGPVPLEQLCLAYVKSDFVDRPDAVRHDAGRAAYQAVFKTAPFDDRQMIVHYYSLTEVGDDGVQFRGHDRAPPVLLLELLIDDRRRINVGRLLFAVAFELGSENDFEIARRKLKTSLKRSESQGMSGLTGTLAEGVGDHVGLRRLDLILADTVRPLIGLKGSVQNLSLSF